MSPSISHEDFGFSQMQMILFRLFVENVCKDVLRGRDLELDAKLTEAYAQGRADEAEEWRRKEFHTLIPASLT